MDSKRCSRCGQVKPLSEFHKHAGHRDGRSSRCKVCRQESRYPDAVKNRRAKQRLDDAGMKRCWRCQRVKPLSDFFNNSSEHDGVTSMCKICHGAYKREFRKGNREKVNRQSRSWCRRNPDKRRATIERRRSREKGADGEFDARDIKRLRKSQKNTCVYCGLNPHCHGALFTYQVDHIIPLSRGGTNNPSNLQLLCPHCNQSKRGKTHAEYLEWLQEHYSDQ